MCDRKLPHPRFGKDSEASRIRLAEFVMPWRLHRPNCLQSKIWIESEHAVYCGGQPCNSQRKPSWTFWFAFSNSARKVREYYFSNELIGWVLRTNWPLQCSALSDLNIYCVFIWTDSNLGQLKSVLLSDKLSRLYRSASSLINVCEAVWFLGVKKQRRLTKNLRLNHHGLSVDQKSLSLEGKMAIGMSKFHWMPVECRNVILTYNFATAHNHELAKNFNTVSIANTFTLKSPSDLAYS